MLPTPSEVADASLHFACESTVAFLMTEKVQPHPRVGAKQVVLSASDKKVFHAIVVGMNIDTYKQLKCVSCTTCTTNS